MRERHRSWPCCPKMVSISMMGSLRFRQLQLRRQRAPGPACPPNAAALQSLRESQLVVTQLGRPKLGVDIDNVLANADAALRRIIRRETAGLVDLAYEDIREFDYRLNRDRNGRSIDDETWQRVHSAFSTAEILFSLPVIAGAVDGLRSLSDVFDIHFVTSRLPAARIPTERWLETLGLDFSYEVHFARHREKHLYPLGLTAVVEDDREQAALFADAGVASVLLAHPWNELGSAYHPQGIIRRESWSEIVACALQLRYC